MKPLIITHKNCVDGCCSQAILRSKYGNDAEYLELDHVNLDPTKDKDAPKYLEQIFAQKNSEVVISDFCLNTEMIDRLLEQNNKVVILDHHASNIRYVEPFEKRMANGEKLNLHINFAKQNDRSGSMLTWEYVYPNVEPPLAVEYVSDGDIWKFKFGNTTKHFYTGLLEPHGDPENVPTELWDKLIIDNNETNKLVGIGEPLHAQYMSEVMYYTTKATPISLNGKPGLMVEAPKKYTSDLGNQLALLGGGFGLVYFVDEETQVVRCSLRSVDPFTVNDLAMKWGGGGHPQASAFRCKNMEEFRNLLSEEGNTVNLISSKKIKP